MEHIILPDRTVRSLSFYLAMEEYVAAALGCGFFVWQVNPTVIIGRNQDLASEVDLDFCASRGIEIVRRKSGGGCVYADRGNLMISFITPERGVDIVFPAYLQRLASVLRGCGVNAIVTGHNDILISGRKVSGSAFFSHPGASIAHSTLMFSVDLDALERAITPPVEKLARHAVRSVGQRVANLREYAPDLTVEAVADALVASFCDSERVISETEIEAIEQLEKCYHKESFILGKAP